MNAYTLARIIHIVGVVLWIGGVAMVTTVIIPMAKKAKNAKAGIETMQQVENRFAKQARITTLITGLSGFYMLYAINGWSRYLELRYWWVHAMTLVWIFFTLMLFVLEPLILHKLFHKKAESDPQAVLNFMYRFHWVALILSLITIIGAAAGSHGWFFIG